MVVCSLVPALRAGLSALIDGDPDLTVWAAVGSLSAAASPDGLPGPLPEECIIVVDAGGLEAFLSEEAALHQHGAALHQHGAALHLQGAALLLVTDEVAATDATGASVLPTAPPLAGLRAWGAIVPEASAEALRAAVRALAEGLNVFSPELLPGHLDGPTAAPPGSGTGPAVGKVQDLVEPLTDREIEVLRRLAEGLTNKQAALVLHISEHTVKFHVSSIYSKLGVTNRAEAVREGARLGLVPL